MFTLHSHNGILNGGFLTSGVTWAQWVWERKTGWWFWTWEASSVFPTPGKSDIFGFLSGHNPVLGSICSCPFTLWHLCWNWWQGSNDTQHWVDHYELRSWCLKGMRELWCPIWLAASRAGHPGAERVLERFSPWRKDKTFKLPNKLFKFSLAKTERLKRKNLALAIRWGSRDRLWFIIKDLFSWPLCSHARSFQTP